MLLPQHSAFYISCDVFFPKELKVLIKCWVFSQWSSHQRQWDLFLEIWVTCMYIFHSSLQWRHNEHDVVSNHQPHDCVYSSVYSGADQSKYKISASLAFVKGIHRRPVNSPHKGPVTRKMFPFWWRHHVISSPCGGGVKLNITIEYEFVQTF